ncbi:MAG: GNAT family N-acetyltransferase [Phycisphaerales bacterium]
MNGAGGAGGAGSVLTGRVVELRPADEGLLDELFRETPRETFRYFLSWPDPWTREEFGRWLRTISDHGGNETFVVVERAGGRVAGCTSYLDRDERHRSVEIGATWYVPGARGTGVNPESKLLLMQRAFEAEGKQRVQLKCDERNVVSQRAIAKLGAVREGVLRKHRILQDGFARNTVFFSVTAEEWPGVKAGLEARVERVARGSG